MSTIRIRTVWQKEARAFVRAHHSHHRRKMQAQEVFRLGAYVGAELVAVALMNCATAPGLCSPEVWEIGRMCCGPSAPKYTASRLYGACGRVMDGAGVQLGITYTRVDERGSSLLAANWIPVAITKGRPHDTGNRAARMLPGLYEPSTEIVDRVRWERGPRAPTTAPAAEWSDEAGRWMGLPGIKPGIRRLSRTVAIKRAEKTRAGERDRTVDIQLGKHAPGDGYDGNARKTRTERRERRGEG